MKKIKWKWIKFWGYHYMMVSPDFSKVHYVIYHRRIFKVNDWDKYFQKNKKND